MKRERHGGREKGEPPVDLKVFAIQKVAMKMGMLG
jgi:hypothetical protein